MNKPHPSKTGSDGHPLEEHEKVNFRLIYSRTYSWSTIAVARNRTPEERMRAWSLLTTGLLTTVVLISTSWARSGKEYKFRGGLKDGVQPNSALVSDGAGNFYGTTTFGGLSCGFEQCGTVFRLSRGPNGKWTESLIYEFKGGTDGEHPYANLTLDPLGNLYGTTSEGGGCGSCGTVFELSPSQGGTWTETIIYTFKGDTDGGYPQSGVIFDAAGSLYGTTVLSGGCNPYCGGTVYKLTPSQGDSWSKSTLFTFPGSVNGQVFLSAVVFDSVGSLYGTTYRGGANSAGTVFQLTPNQDGTWTEADIYSFTDGLDGGYPSGGVIFDTAGNLYGEASEGGSFACPMTGCGVIFKLTPDLGNWTFNVVHTFDGLNGSKGDLPLGGLALDSAGNLYGTTEGGGGSDACGTSGCGTIFELSSEGGGTLTFKMIGAFNNTDGAAPDSGVIVDTAGNLYGTTSAGGSSPHCESCGVVFTLSPQ